MAALGPAAPPDTFRGWTYEVIFGHEPGWGRRFDAILIVFIIASVVAVMLDSVSSFSRLHTEELLAIEWAFTALFTVEYLVRIWCVRPVRAYTLSFFGIIDLLSILPTYLSLLLPGGQYLAVIRVLRVIRVFRVFKLARFLGEASLLSTALRNARYKIAVFLVTVLCIVIVVGSVMYLVEGAGSGFSSIPQGVYWAIVTLTTVGYGDIAPATPLGKALAAFVMILGYGIIAVPTCIVTAEITQIGNQPSIVRTCTACEHIETDADARYCRFCATELGAPAPVSSPDPAPGHHGD
jgi:voltage-gated potassium channel